LWVEEAIVAITELPPSRQGVASSHGLISRHWPELQIRMTQLAR